MDTTDNPLPTCSICKMSMLHAIQSGANTFFNLCSDGLRYWLSEGQTDCAKCGARLLPHPTTEDDL